MNKVWIVLLCFLTDISSPAQNDLQCKNLKQLTFSSKIDSIDSKGVKVYYNNLPDFLFECLVSPSGDTIVQKRFDRSLKVFMEGFFSSESWKYFQREQVDTTMGGVKGILVHGYQSSKPMSVKEFFNFFTIVDNTYFVIVGGVRKELTPGLKKEMDHYSSSARFEGKNY